MSNIPTHPLFSFERWHALAVLILLVIVLMPANAFACACGCAVFDVGTSSLLPTGPGGTVFLEYDFLDQTKNKRCVTGHCRPDRDATHQYLMPNPPKRLLKRAS